MVEPTANDATQSTDPLTSSETKLDDDQPHDSAEVNGDQSQLPNGVTQEEDTQDITMADQLPTTNEGSAPESRIPAKKDATLREFLSKMDDYAPIVRACA
jgi:transcription initiation factor TFIID subunit 10